ncbi:hypothetical protein RUM43_005649 [Polyplax serrata]|uniref:C2H2-type domain-containing protein n=1 Tax=Polyplax serrata TaxID=468196 RepID=A0AAN8NQK5_POLSC
MGGKEEEFLLEKICGDAKCKYVAKDEKDLETHSLVHVGPKVYKCPECPYCAKTNAVMKRHYMIHIDEKQFQCPHCPFKGRLKSHLKRHLRLHTGAKPYKCPHCSYTCNILENLRKHVLNTKIHPGKKLYECKLCRFETNVSKDFKTHLSENHKENCRGSEEAVIVAGIYNREADLTSTATPLPGKRKVSAASAPKPPSEDLKRKIDCIAQKYSPIMPKTSLLEKRENDQSSKSKRNLVEDKRKVLEMELEKLKKQIKPERRAARSYPSPAEKFLQKATKAEDKIGPNKAKEEDEEVEATDESDVLLVNLGPTDTGGELTVQQVKLPPAYVLCDGGSLTLKDSEFYLLEDYDV